MTRRFVSSALVLVGFDCGGDGGESLGFSGQTENWGLAIRAKRKG